MRSFFKETHALGDVSDKGNEGVNVPVVSALH